MRRLFKLVMVCAAVVVAVVAALFASFTVFAVDVALSTAPSDARADGIVVLTGGTARIQSALDLLADGRGKRLLISGVDPKVGRTTLSRVVEPEKRRYFDCCIDLDHSLDTAGNALETRRWVARQGFRSLIVVTSDYHMPRSLAELEMSLPGTRLIAFPVAEDDEPIADRLLGQRSVRLLFGEFLKYLAVRMRNMIGPLPAEPEVRVADRPR